jgi:uroporphyrinogen decarboxylase
MRQAGRILPEYRRLREKLSLSEIFHHSELIATVTTLPVHRLGVDAAILFADILTVIEAFGFSFSFPEKKGPVVSCPIQSIYAIEELEIQLESDPFSYLKEAIPLIKSDLDVPLIGFCGGPFTVASYLIEGGREGITKWIKDQPEALHALLQQLTRASKLYLQMQIQAGVDVIQIFDSWAGELPLEQFRIFAMPYLQDLIHFTQSQNRPVIVFARGSSRYPLEFAALRPDAVSFDWHQEIDLLRKEVPHSIALQGNLNPEVLKGSVVSIQNQTKAMLKKMRGNKGYIANLGHGVLPDTPLSNVVCFIETVQAYS